MPGQARIEDRVTVGFGGAILQSGGNGRLEEVCAVEEGFGALSEERRGGVGICEERREDIGGDGVGEGDHYRRGYHLKGDYVVLGVRYSDNIICLITYPIRNTAKIKLLEVGQAAFDYFIT